MRTAQRAQLALLLEVASTPKPGNVDRRREYPDLRFEHFLAGAVGAFDGLKMASEGEPVGRAFERAIAGMSEQTGGNTQFGALLLLVPLVKASSRGELSSAGVASVAEATTEADTVDFYRAFDHVDVAVREPPDGYEDLDVRRGSEAVAAVEDRGLSLSHLMELSADRDGVAREWVSGFERSFEAADRLAGQEGSVCDRAARIFLALLAAEPDTFIGTVHDEATARRCTERARAALEGELDPDRLAEEFVEAGINPGTTADLVAAGLFIGLERGEVRV